MKKKIFATFLAAICTMPLTACSLGKLTTQATDFVGSVTGNSKESEDLQADENASTGVDINSLESDEFYVLHNGVYYPAWGANANYEQKEEPSDYVPADPSTRQLYYSEEEEKNIPTLYLEKGDKLIYYKDTDAVDYITFERYQDLGYTVPIYNIHATTGDTRYYIDLDEEMGCILPGSSLENIEKDVIEGQNITLSNLGRLDITKDIIRSSIELEGTDSTGSAYEEIDLKSKILKGCVKDETYDLEVYDGTNYLHYLATCNMHAFEQYEIYKSTDVTPLRASAWEVDIPDYFVTGYYRLFAKCIGSSSYTGLVRIVVGMDSYDNDDAESFNKPLLILDDGHRDIAKGAYSETEDLNSWSSTTAAQESLGYITDEDTVDKTQVATNQSTLKEVSMQTYNLTLMENENCTIKINPSEIDASGDVYLLVEDTVKQLTYDRIYNTYTLDIKGDGKCYTLVVAGLWHTYDINLTNIKSTPDSESLSVFPSYLQDFPSLDEVESEDNEEDNEEKNDNEEIENNEESYPNEQ
ncbi:hypothetical protein CSX00_12350 [Pseudobutyrivibrio ruminis]|uniref:Uncharacterized protein n=2 Tax=Pseudobutyrivibrio ruminis TaxID=46206 RepID=A0A2G3E732_9FIRM|nr:hypothetical protein CSX00_12350 [Pseudobutyrivibrio ruminis]